MKKTKKNAVSAIEWAPIRRNSEATQAKLKEILKKASEKWVCCSACGKWRRIRIDTHINKYDEWFCHMNKEKKSLYLYNLHLHLI